MAKELKMMSVKELSDLKHVAQELADKYSSQLSVYGISDINLYIQNLSPQEKEVLSERMKAIRLVEKLDKMIEKKISEYYD